MSDYEVIFVVVFCGVIVLMLAAWQAARIATRWRHQSEDHQAVLRNLQEQRGTHTHLWKNAGFIDDHPIETCWICGVEKPYLEEKSER